MTRGPQELFRLLLQKTYDHIVSHLGRTMGDDYLKQHKLGPYASKQLDLNLNIANIGSFELAKEQPAILTNCSMRDYQLEGLNWLLRLYFTGLNGILADEMGLGKTLQTISLLAHLRANKYTDGPHLILVPLTTLSNWQREFERFCPSISVLRFHGDPTQREDLIQNRLLPRNFDVCVTTYEMASREKHQLKKIKWSYLIVDEAHRLKNEESQLSRVLREYRAEHRLLITGTPLQNTLKDVWALLNFLLPSIFNSSEDFDLLFQSVENEAGIVKKVKASEDGDDDDDDDDDGYDDDDNIDDVYEDEEGGDSNSTKTTATSTTTTTTTSGAARRRADATNDDDAMSRMLQKQNNKKKNSVVETAPAAPLPSSQDEIDDGFRTEVLSKLHTILRPFVLRRLKADVASHLPPKKEIYIHVGMTRLQRKVYHDIVVGNFEMIKGESRQRQKLLNVVIQLRKCCNHPYLFEGIEDQSLPALGDHLITSSGKMIVLDKLLNKIFTKNTTVPDPKMHSKVLIFCQMTSQLNILQDYCTYRGYRCCRIDGSTAPYAREALMEDFNTPGSDKYIFLLSTRAGGVGINLIAADTVVLYDSDWNPQMDLQAMDRAHRLGQTRPVNVYRFITQDSIEERVTMRAEAKLRLDQMVIQQGRTPVSSGSMSKTDMIDLIRNGVNNIFTATEFDNLDEDIDVILTRGEQKTNELNSKLEKFKGFELSLSAPVTSDGNHMNDPNDEDLDDQALEALQKEKLHDLLGSPDIDQSVMTEAERESKALQERLQKEEDENNPNKRVTNRSNYEQERYFLQLFSDAKLTIPRPMKLKIHDCQLYNFPRLEEICRIEQQLYDKFLQDTTEYSTKAIAGDTNFPEPDFTTYVLPQALQDEREMLLQDGFPNWSFFEYKSFVRGNEKYGKSGAWDLISQEIGTKTPDEVKAYAKVFWERFQYIKDGQKSVDSIYAAEHKLATANQLVPYLAPLTQDIHNGFDALCHYTSNALPSTLKNKGYNDELDGVCIYIVSRDGFQAGTVKDSVMQHAGLQFDYFARSRLPSDLYRRVEAISRQFAPKTLTKRRRRKDPEPTVDADGNLVAPPVKKPRGRPRGVNKNAVNESMFQ